MSNIIELEAGYKVDNMKELLTKIEKEKYDFKYNVIEEDTYYTDENFEFIKDRICLRIRKTNNKDLELTFKPKTDDSTEKYGKKEVNIDLKVQDYNDIKYVLKSLKYDEYVSFEKNRTVYSKIIDNVEHNIMVDKIDKIGDYVEFEIITHNEEEKEKMHDELDRFVDIFGFTNKEEKNKPYRDLVKEKD